MYTCGGDALSNMSEENKRALANYIYDFMVQNSFTSPDGYAIRSIIFCINTKVIKNSSWLG